jgi:hypothetical protein
VKNGWEKAIVDPFNALMAPKAVLDTADLYGVDPASSYTRVTIGVGRADLEAWQEREKR